MEWENGDHLKLEQRNNPKWNFLSNLAMVHCFCVCIVYVKLELNKPVHDLLYLPNGLSIYSLCLTGLSFQFSLADGASISLKRSHETVRCQHFLLVSIHPRVRVACATFPANIPSIGPTSLHLSPQQSWVLSDLPCFLQVCYREN